jgi:hypothetical protein
MPLQKKILEIDTSNTTQFDGEYSFLYRDEKYMKIVEADVNVKTKSDFISSIKEKKGETNEKWSEQYKKSIDCSNVKGFSAKQYCKRKRNGGKYKTEG